MNDRLARRMTTRGAGRASSRLQLILRSEGEFEALKSLKIATLPTQSGQLSWLCTAYDWRV